MMDLLGENRTNECHQYIIRKMSTRASSPEVLDQIESIWRNHNDPLLNEHDYMEMAYRLAIMHPQQWQEILSTQRARLTTEDLRNEFDYVSRACNPNADQRLQLFNSRSLGPLPLSACSTPMYSSPRATATSSPA